jgi:CubicO group peptidase (beta-lactamase class C family)
MRIVPLLLAAALPGLAAAGPAPPPAALRAAAAYSAAREGVSFVVLVDRRVVFEEYANGASAASAHEHASGTKSFSGVMAAAAVKDGLLALDERVSDTLPEWRSDPRKREVTLRQLLSLTSGVNPVSAEVPTGPRSSSWGARSFGASLPRSGSREFLVGAAGK